MNVAAGFDDTDFSFAYYGGGATTRLVCGYLACDARLAGILLAGLPLVVRVNVRGSSAGISPSAGPFAVNTAHRLPPGAAAA